MLCCYAIVLVCCTLCASSVLMVTIKEGLSEPAPALPHLHCPLLPALRKSKSGAVLWCGGGLWRVCRSTGAFNSAWPWCRAYARSTHPPFGQASPGLAAWAGFSRACSRMGPSASARPAARTARPRVSVSLRKFACVCTEGSRGAGVINGTGAGQLLAGKRPKSKDIVITICIVSTRLKSLCIWTRICRTRLVTSNLVH